jgi:hypothetical protein
MPDQASQLKAFLSRTQNRRGRAFDRRVKIASGDWGTGETIREMARLAAMGARDPIIKLKAIDILEGIKGRDQEGIARRFFDWMQDRGSGEKSGVKFTNDAWHVEQVWAPWMTLTVSGSSDCDDFSTTMCALLLSVGVPCFFRTVKVNPQQPDLFSHVYAVALLKGKKLALDASVPFTRPGQEPKTKFGVRDWAIETPEEDDRV